MATVVVNIIPDVEIADCRQLEDSLLASHRRLQSQWLGSSAQIMDLLVNHGGLWVKPYPVMEIPGWKKAMDKCLSGDYPEAIPFKNFQKFTAVFLNDKTKTAFPKLQHAFFDSCQQHWDNVQV